MTGRRLQQCLSNCKIAKIPWPRPPRQRQPECLSGDAFSNASRSHFYSCPLPHKFPRPAENTNFWCGNFLTVANGQSESLCALPYDPPFNNAMERHTKHEEDWTHLPHWAQPLRKLPWLLTHTYLGGLLLNWSLKLLCTRNGSKSMASNTPQLQKYLQPNLQKKRLSELCLGRTGQKLFHLQSEE